VTTLIAQRIPATLHLAAGSLAMGLILAIPVVLLGSLRRGRIAQGVTAAYNGLALGVPTFWVGILLIIVLAVPTGWFPAVSSYVPVWESPIQAMRNLFLPSLTLGILVSGIFSRFLLTAIREEIASDYIRTARSKGLHERVVLVRHALRNALLPFLTVLGLVLGSFLGGTVVTESVFNYPGLGRLVYQAVLNRDYRLLQGVILLIIVMYTLVNAVVDLLYTRADPRVQLEKGGADGSA
jgi:peptide/nickel transport system permease protein